MTVARLISPPLRAGLLVAMGSALIAVPFTLGLSGAAIVVGVVTGTITFGVGVAGTASEGRGTLSISAQADFDRGLAIGLLVAAVAFAANGEMAAVAVFGTAALIFLLIAGFSRYAASPAF
jgi:hypothetical protein